MIKPLSVQRGVVAAWLIATGLLILSLNASAERLPPPTVAADDSSCTTPSYNETIIKRFSGSKLDTSKIDALAGRTISNIRYLRIGVFDEDNPDENNSLYRFLNTLHVTTKESVVSSQLLFAKGDKLNPDLLHETERILRRRGYLSGAFIVPEVICDTHVDLVVVTRDSWSLEVNASFSHSGGDSQSGSSFRESNILGSGNSFAIGYAQDESRNGVSYTFATDHLFNTRVVTHLSYADKSDGENVIAEIKEPFFSRETPWSTGVVYRDLGRVELIRSRGKEINQFHHDIHYKEFFYGRKLIAKQHSTQRLLMGYTHEEDHFLANEHTRLGIPANRQASYPWLEYQYLEDRYAVYRNLNQIQRSEDVPLGVTVKFRAGYGEAGIHRNTNVLRYIGSYQHIYRIHSHDLFAVNFSVDGREHRHASEQNSTLWTAQATYNLMQNYKNRWYGSIRYDAGHDLAQYEQLTVGGAVGLRGYPSEFQRGNRRLLVTLERRYYSNWHVFSLIRVGAVAFVEAGKAWRKGQDNPMLANVGIGLRLSSSKVQVGNVLHIDIASPLVANDNIKGYQILIDAQHKF